VECTKLLAGHRLLRKDMKSFDSKADSVRKFLKDSWWTNCKQLFVATEWARMTAKERNALVNMFKDRKRFGVDCLIISPRDPFYCFGFSL